MSRRAIVSRLVRRSVSAWALPRPSATASARFAKITVSQSQATIVQLKIVEFVIAVYVVRAAPISTTNMTGFLIWTLGSSFSTASGSDFQIILGSRRPPPIRLSLLAGGFWPPATEPCVVITDMSGLLISVEAFRERPERQRGEVGQANEDEDDADEHADEQGPVRLHAPRPHRPMFVPSDP